MNTSENSAITIDIISDVVCPWCYVGKKRLEMALSELGHTDDIHIRWHPFQLDPTIPAEGMDRRKYFIRKFGDEGRIRQMSDHLTRVGEEAGIAFKLDEITQAINTLPLHKLLHVANREGFQHEAEEVLFRAYFTEGRDLQDPAVLAELFAPFGWDKQKVSRILADDAIGDAVREEISYYQQLGISGVPFFILNNKYGLSGAQPAVVFMQALTTVRDEMLQTIQGDVCGPEGC